MFENFPSGLLALLILAAALALVVALQRRGARAQAPEEAAPAPAQPAAPSQPAPQAAPDADLAVLAAAAIAAYLGTSADRLVVRSIRRIAPSETPWIQAGRTGSIR